ncbi:hypothetical protein EJ08DRAFT_307280 [Tothia fuscella]|uniref:F-box domain-containing protein n=1 Tax=Tothia fuscella TaxID=1048955 RepID=A0A9P4TXD7_9PEZI|nr:hypothetical protein EJ08DRAFT_307280 [Tothia fuscella]
MARAATDHPTTGLSLTNLPAEILLKIFHSIEEDSYFVLKATLQHLQLTCKFINPLAREVRFSCIELSSNRRSTWCSWTELPSSRRFTKHIQFLEKISRTWNHDIGGMVRKLEFEFLGDSIDRWIKQMGRVNYDHTIAAILEFTPGLVELKFDNWKTMPETSSAVLQLSKLSRVTIQQIACVDSLLRYCNTNWLTHPTVRALTLKSVLEPKQYPIAVQNLLDTATTSPAHHTPLSDLTPSNIRTLQLHAFLPTKAEMALFGNLEKLIIRGLDPPNEKHVFDPVAAHIKHLDVVGPKAWGAEFMNVADPNYQPLSTFTSSQHLIIKAQHLKAELAQFPDSPIPKSLQALEVIISCEEDFKHVQEIQRDLFRLAGRGLCNPQLKINLDRHPTAFDSTFFGIFHGTEKVKYNTAQEGCQLGDIAAMRRFLEWDNDDPVSTFGIWEGSFAVFPELFRALEQSRGLAMQWF